MKRRFLCVAVVLPLVTAVTSAYATTPASVQAALQKAINGPQRTPAYVKRDRFRHPLGTLEFFGIRPDMKVVEVLPGGGWYTEILAPFLRDHGKLIEATPAASSPSPFQHREALKYQQKLAANPAVYGRVTLEPFEPPAYMALGAPDSADMVLTFLNMHDLMYANVHGGVTDTFVQRFFRSAYRTLKPGGILGIVAHRAPPTMPISKSFKLARLPQPFVIAQAERAGFQLAGTSEIVANAKDPRNIPVFDLPPMLMVGAKDRARYQAIGPGDDMTLKFVKPTHAAGQ
ncbi:methyltransferase [Acidiphilium acidophilum]|uniref:class I SAM-dependent methyltransferase n=1 Tax=Acidiphilium acidophilum TaxID=76588 RepID=UPI002E8E74C7|nr:methyltransferase [Acidiphilium acidophilum]